MERRVGSWELLERLGGGAAGTVWRAAQGERRAAVKLARADASPEARRRMLREARALTRLAHPALVKVLEAGGDEAAPWLAMELVEGESLQARLAGGPLEPREAAGVIHELALGLDYAHRCGVLHRDVKPANVVLRPDGAPVLVDFGLVQDRGPLDGVSRSLTREGAVQGTLGFAAPEQVNGDRGRIGPLTDVHGLGATLYALLTGRPPYVGNELTVAVATLEQAPEPPAGIDPTLSRLVLACLAKPPDERPSAEALARALAGWLRGVPPPRREGWSASWLVLAGAGTLAAALVASWPDPAIDSGAGLAVPASHVSPAPVPSAAPPEPPDSASPPEGIDFADQRRALLSGVSRLPGNERLIPGIVCLTSPQAFPIATARDRDGVEAAYAAAAFHGGGRVVVLAHNRYLLAREAGGVEMEDAERLVLNAIRWLGAGKAQLRVGALAEVWTQAPGEPPAPRGPAHDEPGAVVGWLSLVSIPARLVRAGPLDLSGVEVVVWGPDSHISPADQRALRQFVERGGGLLVALCPWGRQQLVRPFPFSELSWNRVLAPLGLHFASEGSLSPPRNDGFMLAPPTTRAHAGRILVDLERPPAGEERASPREARITLARALQSVPAEGSSFQDEVTRLARESQRPEVRAMLEELLDGKR